MNNIKSLTFYILNLIFFSGVLIVGVAFGQQSCFGARCDGLLPTSTTCFSDSTSAGFLAIRDWNELLVGSIELRYSPSCKTVWSEVNSYYPASTITAEVGGGTYPQYPTPGAYSTTVYGGSYPNGVYSATSPMNYAPVLNAQISATGSFTATIYSIFNCQSGGHGDCTPIENSFWGSASYGSYQY